MDKFDDYYNNELHSLKTGLDKFINKHQSIFSDIKNSVDDISDGNIDSYLEKIVNSFAFLTARLKYQNDNLFNEIAKKLITVIYPEIMEDVYCRGLIKFNIDNLKSNLQIYKIHKYQEFLTYDKDGNDIKFSVKNNETLIPAEILHISLSDFDLQNPGKYIKIDIDVFGEIYDGTIIKFYVLNNKKFSIFDSIVSCICGRKCKICDESGELIFDSEIIYDLIDSDYNQYSLLKEYITFSDRFLYFSIRFKEIKNKKIFVYVPVDKDLVDYDISGSNISFNVLPIYNVYKKYTDPIIYDNKKLEYLLIPNAKKHKYERISKIINVIHSDKKNYSSKIIPNYFSVNKQESFYWISRDVKNPEYDGCDKYISFIDTGINYSKYNDSVFYAEVLCTNRNINNTVNTFSKFTMETGIPITKISLINGLYKSENIKFSYNFFLKFLLMVNRNYFTFLDKDDDIKSKLDRLLEIFHDTYTKNVYFSDIDKLILKKKSKRVGDQVWRGVISGYSIDIFFKDDFSGSKILFGVVIANIFNRAISINSFLEVRIFDKCKKLISFQLKGKVSLI